MDAVRDYVAGKLATGINATQTNIPLQTGHGARFPDPATDGQYNIIIYPDSYADPTDARYADLLGIYRIVSKTGDTLTAKADGGGNREGQEGLPSIAHNSAGVTYAVRRVWAAKDARDIRDTKAAKSDVQNQANVFAASSTGNDSYAITLNPAPTAYTSGMAVEFRADVANTGAATLNVNGLGAKTIKKHGNVDLSDGDIKAGQIVRCVYDGTNFQMESQLGTAPPAATTHVVIRKTADETVNNSTTFQNDDHLLWSVGANETWVFELYVHFSGDGSARFKAAITVPTGATLRVAGTSFGMPGSGINIAETTTSGAACAYTNSGDTWAIIRISGSVLTGATAGNVVLQWAQLIATAANTSVLRGSTLVAHRI